ncbi:DUF4179 domain-containing protein [Rummeliibacillus pycnus]|uniref:DUF4179 domain-containing protein n=1 Tax=Rummeliibacillus pycnus TaxID=101070 RepID=UPI003D29A4C2
MDNKEIKFVIDQIEVPKEEVLNAIDRGINQSNQMDIKRYSHKKKIMISSIVAASIFGITLFSGFINPNMNRVLAEAPFIGGIYEEFGDKMGLNLAKQNLITELDQSITKNGVTVKLNDAYFDGDVVSITGHVNGNLDDGKNEKGEVSFDVNFENNKGDNDPWLNNKSTEIKKTVNGYDFQWKLAYPYKTIKEYFTLPISIHYINGIKGDWNFNIPITQHKNKTLTINHSESYQKERIQININEIKMAKASSTLEFETISNYKNDQIDIEKATDEKGNVIFYYSNNTRLSQSKEEDGYHLTLRKTIKKIDSDLQSITFYPFMSISDPPVQHLLNTPSFLLESERTDLGIRVNNITIEGNKLILDYQFQGLAGEMSNHRQDLLLNNLSYAFKLIDKDYVDKIDPDNPVPPKNHSISTNKVKLLDKKTYHFQSVFKLDGVNKIENFSLKDTVLQFDFSNFIGTSKLTPFTVDLPK